MDSLSSFTEDSDNFAQRDWQGITPEPNYSLVLHIVKLILITISSLVFGKNLAEPVA